MPFVATAVARPHASVVVLTVTWQVTAALKALRDGVVGATADGATPLSLHAAASVTSAAARASFSRRVMGHLGGGRAARTARALALERGKDLRTRPLKDGATASWVSEAGDRRSRLEGEVSEAR